jgi:AcrR family transcriptional regulator
VPGEAAPAWADRVADRSPLVQRSRSRSVEQARVIVDAARSLIIRQGEFTTQQLVKEAGIALQTFYRYFASKDQLIVAVLEDLISEFTQVWEAEGKSIADPVARLRFYVTRPLWALDADGLTGPRGITAEHWRLQQLFPEEMAHVDRPLVELMHRTLLDAQAAGMLSLPDAEHDAWLIVNLVRSVYHHYAFAPTAPAYDEIANQVWSFCARAVGAGPVPD